MAKQVADYLRAARKLIERPECWTKGCYARNSQGQMTCSLSPSATCWCAYGAVERAVGKQASLFVELDAINALERVLPEHFARCIGHFNDAPTTTHADILALFDRAIEAEDAAP